MIDALALQKDLAEAEARLAVEVSGARRANLLLTLSFLALMAGLLLGLAWLLWPGLVGVLLGALEILRRLRLIAKARDARLDLMMALAALASTPTEDPHE